ncbi:MAG: PHP domain-containing protein [Thermomicrobiales bacterium]
MSAALSNRRLAERLERHARLLEIAGESAFRARAYTRAAETVRELDVPASELARDGQLQSLPGVGEAMAGAIAGLLESGTFTGHDELSRRFPETLLDLAEVPGIGPKSVNKLYTKLQIATLEQLEAAITSGSIAGTPGLGNRVQKAASEGLVQMSGRTGRIPLGTAKAAAAMFVTAYAVARPHDRVSFAGGVRRWDVLVDELCFVIATTDAGASQAAIAKLPGVERVTNLSEDELAVLFDDDKRGRVSLAKPESFGSVLVRMTGSPEHIARLGEIPAECPSEEIVYGNAGLPWIPPELRSSAEAFSRLDELGALITTADLNGELHAHSTWSDGQATIEEMAQSAKGRGYRFLGITDHSQSLGVANGLDRNRLIAQRVELAAASAAIGIPLLAGAEVEVLSDGSLDYPDAVLAELDVVIGSLHGGLRQPRPKLVDRQLRTLRNPHVDILAHPSGRLLERREGGDFDWDLTFATAAETGTALEINADPARLDLDPGLARQAAEAGCLITINSDSHWVDGFDMVEFGVMMARKAWLKPGNVLNAWEPERVLLWLRDRPAALA